MGTACGIPLFSGRSRVVRKRCPLPIRRAASSISFLIFWCGEKAWGLGDLHSGNIMRDASGAAVVIDALLAEIPRAVTQDCPGLARALATARRRADGDFSEEPDLFTGVNDAEL